MRKLFIFIATLILSAGLSLSAQKLTQVRVEDGEHNVKFPVVATDVLDSDGETIAKMFDLSRKASVQYYTVPVYVDSSAHPGTLGHYVPILLQQSFDKVTWATITTVNYYATTSDTTFNFQDVSTGISAPYLRVYFNGSDADSVNIKVTGVYGRFLNK